MITLVRVLFWLPSVVLIIYFLSYALEQRTALFSCFDSSGYLFYVEGFNYNYFEPDSVL